MKKRVFVFLTLAVFWFCFSAAAAPKVSVEMLYMNHGPLQSTLREVDKIFDQYKDKIIVAKYDFESPEGEKFMQKKGIRQHIPLMIWIGGKNSAVIDGKEIRFAGFPSGTGPDFAQGKWTMKDLRRALDQAAGR